MLKKEKKGNAEEWLPNAARAELFFDHCHLDTNSKCIYNLQVELLKKSETKKNVPTSTHDRMLEDCKRML